MRKIWIAVALSCVGSHSAVARDWLCGRSEVWGEAIYWKPVNQNHEWANRFVGPVAYSDNLLNSGNFETQNICSDCNAGVRVGASYALCRLFVDVSGGYIQFKDDSRATGNLFPMLPFQFVVLSNVNNFNLALDIVGAGRSDLSVYHWHAALRGGVRCSRCLQVRIFGGVRYTNLQERQKTRIAGTEENGTTPAFVDLRQVRRLEYSGAGPLLGLSADTPLFCGLGVRAEGEIIALIGSRKMASRAHFVTPPLPSDRQISVSQLISQDRSVAIVPAFDCTGALHYSVSCRRVTGRVEIGYSLTYYRKILNVPPSGSTIPSLISQQSLRSAGFAGPYLGGSLAF